jgi:hypothetical protein
LRDRDYCAFHLQQIGRRTKAARSRARHSPLLRLPLLEDLHSVQMAIMQLGDALAYREIDPQYARLLTTVLRLAMQNLKTSLPLFSALPRGTRSSVPAVKTRCLQ